MTKFPFSHSKQRVNMLSDSFPSLTSTVLGLFTCLICLSYVLPTYSKSSKGARLPPGPKPKPLIGNLLDMPPKGARVERYWTKHKELYGPISHLNVFGQHIVVLNDAEIAYELLNKRSRKYSGRPYMVFASELCDYQYTIVFSQPSDEFRAMRKICHSHVGSVSAIQKWDQEIDIEVRRYLLRVSQDPANFVHHLRKEAGAIILKLMYAYEVNPHGPDVLVDLTGDVLDQFSRAAVPGEWLVDFVPILKYLPEWFPGASFQRTAKKWKTNLHAAASKPFEFAKRQISQGISKASFVSVALTSQSDGVTAVEEQLIKQTALSLYAGGADTTVAVMEIFYLVMILFPEVQRKAQEEIDTVIGNGRLPDSNDKQKLPYVEAICKEVLRWQPIVEVTVPHMATEDDFYDDYFIPKDTMVLAHVAGVFHDPAIYPEPYEFKPERFLSPTPAPDPNDMIWGFGRRVCPVFQIEAIDGQEIKYDFTPGTVTHPAPFEIDLKVRSVQHERLIKAVEIDHPFPAEGDGKLL